MTRMAEAIDREAWMSELAMALYYLKGRRPYVDQFLDGVAKRLAVGEREYGNASFARGVDTIVREILDETLDRAGWCYVLERACRVQIAAGTCKPDHEEALRRLADSCRNIAQAAFASYVHDAELLDYKPPSAPLDERDGAWCDAD